MACRSSQVCWLLKCLVLGASLQCLLEEVTTMGLWDMAIFVSGLFWKKPAFACCVEGLS